MAERSIQPPTEAADSPAGHDQMRGLLRYAPWMEREVVCFQRHAYPRRDPRLIGPRWRWMFIESASRVGVDPMVWIYRKNSRIVAHQGAIPVRLQVGRQTIVTGWFVETMALEEVRGKAIGPMVVRKALEAVPCNLSLGQTAHMRQLQLAMGWTPVRPLNTYVLLLNPSRVLESKIPGKALRWATATAVECRRFGAAFGRRVSNRRVQVQLLSHFDERHDRMWERMSSELCCAGIRDASFLNWKFIEQPGQELLCIEARLDGQPVGVAIIAMRAASDAYPYRRAMVLDAVVPVADSPAVWALLSAVERAARNRQADSVVFDVAHPLLERRLVRYGYWKREATRQFLVATGDVEEPVRRLMLHADNWYLTRADSDIDRPW